MKDFSRAKEIYFTYSGSKFQMMRDGVSAEYHSYQVPDELEKEWLVELIKRELDRLDINNADSLFPLWYVIETNCKSEYVENIIEFIEINKTGVQSELNLARFAQKVLVTIDRLESSCDVVNRSTLNKYRKRIEILGIK